MPSNSQFNNNNQLPNSKPCQQTLLHLKLALTLCLSTLWWAWEALKDGVLSSSNLCYNKCSGNNKWSNRCSNSFSCPSNLEDNCQVLLKLILCSEYPRCLSYSNLWVTKECLKFNNQEPNLTCSCPCTTLSDCNSQTLLNRTKSNLSE